jgi:hypothetical protein
MIWEGEWDKALEENEMLYAKWLPFNDLILSLS